MIDEVSAGLAPEEFWRQLEQNLRAGHVRLVFVADRLPDELVRIIEFLNEQMSPAEVLGVEVQQYTDGDTRVLVPRLVGATSAAKATKERSTGTPWNEASMLEVAQQRCSVTEIETLKALLGHAAKTGTKLSWGKGLTPGVSAWYMVNGRSRPVWAVNLGTGSGSSKANLSLWHTEIGAELSTAQFGRFIERLRSIESFRQDIDTKAHKSPYSALAHLSDDELTRFEEIVDELAEPPTELALPTNDQSAAMVETT